ncbi:Haloacid dehalogenase-like hydrolase (plasmid) [Rickettsiales bacterium Ac37b]|nr:Haloacid dehalogenase-like hydrolase [Rickettsiales bacterium Ac37b]
MIIAIDMDGVLCSEEKTFSRSLAKPIVGAAESLRKIRKEGHKVIIYSARSWAELEMTQKWLEDNGFEYDGIHLGKITVDCFIDDRALGFKNWEDTLDLIKNFKKDN